MVQIQHRENKVSISGPVGMLDFRRILAKIEGVRKETYPALVLDFRACKAAQAGPMLAICSECMKLRHSGLSISLLPPRDEKLARLFLNTNWAHLIDPTGFGASQNHGFARVPATNFTSAADQRGLVGTMVDALMKSMKGFSRTDLSAIEWALSEITDNVLNHAQSPLGGFAQINILKAKRQIEYVVCDAGIGIPQSLRSGIPTITTDSEALDHAIREGVTRDKKLGQGNGLFGSYQISRVSGGFFHIHSGSARLDYDQSLDLPRLSTETIPYQGTLVVASIDISRHDVLAKALRFTDGVYQPMDSIEYRYESRDSASTDIILRMREQASSFGSRVAGVAVRTKLRNLIDLSEQSRIIIDFSELPVISSSFADEVIGKLFLELGAVRFMKVLEFQHVSPTVRQIIDRAIAQRSASET